MTGCKVDMCKRRLDKYLSTIPDEPQVLGYTAQRRADSNSVLQMAKFVNAYWPSQVEVFGDRDSPQLQKILCYSVAGAQWWPNILHFWGKVRLCFEALLTPQTRHWFVIHWCRSTREYTTRGDAGRCYAWTLCYVLSEIEGEEGTGSRGSRIHLGWKEVESLARFIKVSYY